MAEGNNPPRKRGRPPKVATEAQERTPRLMHQEIYERFMVELRAFAVASNLLNVSEMDERAKNMNAILDNCRGVK